MRCKKEEFIAGEYFHVYNHAVGNETLFKTENDYDYFLEEFSLAKRRYSSSIVAYCLMPNHFHYLLRQDGAEPIYRIFNDAFTSYTLHYNSKYERKGTLFQGPLQHVHVKTDNYLIQLCKYIHFNPKKAGLVDDLKEWKYSNYLEWIGLKESEMFNSEFSEMYPDDFENYEETTEDYQKYLEENEFKKILFD